MSTEAWPPVPARITEAEVGIGEQLARGGASTVFSVLGQRKTLLYKRYNKPRNAVDLDQLVGALGGWGENAIDHVRGTLAWPVATVVDGDQASGALVVRAAAEFHLTLPSGRVKVRDFNFLLYEKRAEKLGVPRATDREKVDLLRGLLDVLLWLDEHGFVHEDLASHNLLWKLDPPEVFVLDCDSLRPLAGDSRSPLYTTVDWTDPRVLTAEVERPDRASTSYVLGLLAPRTLVSPYWYPGDPLPAERFPAALTELVGRSCGPAASRPSLTEWGRGLDAASAQTTGTVVEPAPVRDPAVVRLADRWVFAGGLLFGALVAVFVLVSFV
ncbi:hypothetical protein VA596_31770 [Amycolatopsis sp., V23-08]|uniref:Protein kinase domain-containing protein n=1 Tax=Amycolatopsis heterodermiae TaxID=3110235 RepID=A0ABU5RF03_9PSEU|nr:hypothetical protein [Amycolatopsis sp., V23-08]MEA5364150.1 hypothetical protein [Amycolatopsis sp., V23-08]